MKILNFLTDVVLPTMIGAVLVGGLIAFIFLLNFFVAWVLVLKLLTAICGLFVLYGIGLGALEGIKKNKRGSRWMCQ